MNHLTTTTLAMNRDRALSELVAVALRDVHPIEVLKRVEIVCWWDFLLKDGR